MSSSSEEKIGFPVDHIYAGKNEPEALMGLISSARRVLAGCGGEFSQNLARLDSLSSRLQEERFHLAVLGQFKRGKSTLLNALLGSPVLPMSVIPLTATPTFIKWGLLPGATVYFQDKRPPEQFSGKEIRELNAFLAEFVSEEKNPGNRFGVAEVEVSYPARILQSGVVLIDTPGIGSTFRHNTEATLNFLPQCDAGLFVVSPDPPLTEVEVEFLKEVRSKMNYLFFVFNKSDYLNEEELAQSVDFFKRMLKEKAGISQEPVIFCVSALKGLRARGSGSSWEWEESGIEKVQDHLVNFLAQNKKRVLEEAIARKCRAVVQDAVMHLQLGIQSLKMPLEQLEEKMRLLEEKLETVKYQRVLEGDLLEGDKKRAIAQLEQRAGELRKGAYKQISEIIHDFILVKNQTDEERIKEELRRVIPAFFEHAFGEVSDSLEKEVRRMLQSHQGRCEELIQGIRREAAHIFEIPYVRIEQLEALELEKNPHWVTHIWDDSFGMPPEGFFDGFLPSALRRRRILRRVDERIDALVVRNVENVRWSIFQILNDTFRNFADLIDKRLAEAVASTKDAINAAYLQRKERSETVESELIKMTSVKESLILISNKLELFQKSLGGEGN